MQIRKIESGYRKKKSESRETSPFYRLLSSFKEIGFNWVYKYFLPFLNLTYLIQF